MCRLIDYPTGLVGLAAALIVGAGVCSAPLSAAETAPSETGPQRTVTLLDDGSYWRFYASLRPPVATPAAPAGSRDDEPVVLPVVVPYRSYPGIERIATPGPPAGWTDAEFDDGAWPRARAGGRWPGSIPRVVLRPGLRFSVSTISMRGKFTVNDPSTIRRLELSLGYRGGVAVFLNGEEVTRRDLPDGALDAATPAAPYPAEAFVDAQGKPIPGPYHAAKRIEAGEADLAESFARRDRSLGQLALPHELLRKGTNVLAVEVHRSDYHSSALSWFGSPHLQRRCAWAPVGLLEVKLLAKTDAVGAVAANVARPEGVQVWNEDLNNRVTVLDYGDPHEPLRPVTIVAARNGAFSGKVVLGSTGPVAGLSAEASDLRGAGNQTIPAGMVEIRYPRTDGRGYQRPDWFDGLRDRPPAEVPVHPHEGAAPWEAGGAAIQPIWVTVNVPRNAPPGQYRGELTIAARDIGPIRVPIELDVADWTLRDPKDFRTYVGIYQSPTSLAMQYGVEEWSEEHWRLMERSFALLGQVGGSAVNVPISNRTQFGNDEGMVYWIRKPDGSFDYDFSVLDRYLGLVKRHLGVPDFVVLHVWHSGGWETRAADQQNTVTVVDPRTGERERVQVPTFGTDQSKRFWKPVLDAIRERLAHQGMEKSMCLGILSDGTAPPEVFAAFDEIVPGGARWTRGCHRAAREEAPYPLKGGGHVVLHEFCYGMAMADPAKGLPPIWRQRTWPGAAFIRHNFDDNLSLLKYRTMPERALYCGTRGVGRVGLDFFDVMEDERGRRGPIYNRWPHSSCAQREPNLFRMAAPGPEGTIPTVRFEQFRQGVQDAEAMIFVADALANHPDRLGEELAARCRKLFVDRIHYCLTRCPEAYNEVYFRTDHYGWQELTRRLYTTAAEVGQKLPGERD